MYTLKYGETFYGRHKELTPSMFENKYILREMTLETNEHTRKLKSSEM